MAMTTTSRSSLVVARSGSATTRTSSTGRESPAALVGYGGGRRGHSWPLCGTQMWAASILTGQNTLRWYVKPAYFLPLKRLCLPTSSALHALVNSPSCLLKQNRELEGKGNERRENRNKTCRCCIYLCYQNACSVTILGISRDCTHRTYNEQRLNVLSHHRALFSTWVVYFPSVIMLVGHTLESWLYSQTKKKRKNQPFHVESRSPCCGIFGHFYLSHRLDHTQCKLGLQIWQRN
jgi:hypothetical protein